MIQAIDRSRFDGALAGILTEASRFLHPKLCRLLNPNVIDAKVRLQLHFGNGALNHIRDADEEPAYVGGLKANGQECSSVPDVLKNCLKALRGRIEHRLGPHLHGIVTLKVDISGGEATIASEVDWVHKPSATK